MERNIGGFLNRLEEDYDLIDRVRPINAKPKRQTVPLQGVESNRGGNPLSTTGAGLFGRAQTRNAGRDLDSAIPRFHSRIVGWDLFLIGEIPVLISAKQAMQNKGSFI